MYISDMQQKIQKKLFVDDITAFCTCSLKFCILREEYWHSAVNVLAISPKISELTRTDIFELNLSQILEIFHNSAA